MLKFLMLPMKFNKQHICFVSFCWLLSVFILSAPLALAQASKDIALQAQATSPTAITLSWNNPAGGETLILERKTGEGAFEVLTTPAGSTTYSDENLMPDSLYTYRIHLETQNVYSNEMVISANTYIPQAIKTGQDGQVLKPVSQSPGDILYSNLAVGTKYPIFQAPPCLEGSYWVGVQLAYSLVDWNADDNWTAALEIEFMQGEQVLWTKTLTNNMQDQLFQQMVFHYAPVSCVDNYTVRVKSKSTDTSIPQEKLTLTFILHRDDLPFDTDVDVNLKVAKENNQVTAVSWTPVDDFVGHYDLEWVFIASHENFTGTTAAQAFAFKEGLRISTAKPLYTHQFFYPNGKIWFRIRAVGINPQYPEHLIPGAWQYVDGADNNGIATINAEGSLNWQANTTLAEDGKYKKILQYYDGTLRNRQSVTNISSENRIVVGESLYDFEGRPAVNILPVPVSQTASGLTYHDNLNQFSSTESSITANTSASKHKFHYDNASLKNSTLSPVSGAGKYYASANNMDVPNRDYIPDAKGYAYSQQSYKRDATGRISRQAGVGEAFRMDVAEPKDDHTTRYFYGTASQQELQRLFGNNVGKAAHYTKNMTVDPNNQVSVTYQDQEGRTVATALAGDKPDNLEALESYEALPNTNINVDISDKNSPTKAGNILQHTLLNTSPGTQYNFVYQLSALGSQIAGMGCESCTFQLEISLTDPDGNLVDLSDEVGNEATTGKKYVKKNITAASCTAATEQTISFSKQLNDVGDYTIQKKLIATEKTIRDLKEQLRTTASVQTKITELETRYVIDSSACEVCTDGEKADAAIAQAITEVSEQDCANIMKQIELDIRAKRRVDREANVPNTPEEDAPLSQTELDAHLLYCKYELCQDNKSGKEFERKITRIGNWSAAISSGLITDESGNVDIASKDPFFIDQKHSEYKAGIHTKLANVVIGAVAFDSDGDKETDGTNTLSGSLYDVTNPDNTAFYLDENGNFDVNGMHILYWDLIKKYREGGIVEADYQEQLNTLHWSHFKSFYLEAKRQVNLEIAIAKGCSTAIEELQIKEGIPTEKEALKAWGESKGITGPISETELDMKVNSFIDICDITLDEQQKSIIRTNLQAYFNARPDNFFRLILQEDLVTPKDKNLAAIDNVLKNHSCGISPFAVENPMECLESEVVVLENDISYAISNPSMAQASINSDSNPGKETGLKLQRAKNSNKSQPRSVYSQILDSIFKSNPGASWADLKEQYKLYYRENIMNLGKDVQKADTLLSPLQLSSPSVMQTTSSQGQVPDAIEQAALEALYNSTNGNNWNRKKNWLSCDPCTSYQLGNWAGVIVIDGDVQQILLSYNNLSGTLPPELANLAKLGEINFYHNEIGGNIPPEWVNLHNLTELILSENNLFGNIPAELGLFDKLDGIYIDNNRFYGNIPSEIFNNKITQLELSYNDLTGEVPITLSNAISLQTLSLDHNLLIGNIPTLENLLDLGGLDLSYNNFTGTINFNMQEDFYWLDLSHNHFNGTISLLTSYDFVDLSYNQLEDFIITASSIDDGGNYWLDISHNNLSGNIANNSWDLTDLWFLNLSYNHLSGNIPTSLNEIGLTTLLLNNNNFEGSLPTFTNLYPYSGSPTDGAPFLEARFRIDSNQFVFDDIEPLFTDVNQSVIPSEFFNYAPQDTVGVEKTLTVYEGQTLNISYPSTATQNKYQWQKQVAGNWQDISGATQREYKVTNTTQQSDGKYRCIITNNWATELTLYTRTITVDVVPLGENDFIICKQYKQDNPTLANFRFDINWDDRLEQCLGARQAETDHLLRVATDKLLEEEVTQLLRTGNTSCLSKATESMTYTYAPKEYHYTLYYYDQAGNLVQTVPPKGVKPLTQAQISSNADPAHTLLTRYAYNSLNQLTAQQTPDAGKSQFWYDSQGQLRLSQNAQQQADNHYSYTRYDALGRVTEVGEMNSTEPVASLQALLDDSAFPDNSYGLHDITTTHYDEPAAAMMPIFAQQHLRSRVSWVEVKEDPQDVQAVPVRTYYSYDAHGNVKALLQQLPGMSAKRTDYVYDLVSGNVNMVIYQYGASDQLMQKYRYDADNRLQQVHTSTDGYVWNQEAMYKYYAHGPLARIELGKHRVQGLDYYYTLQGWLKGVNGTNDANDPGQDGMGISRVGKDAFAFALGYFEGDYQGIGATPTTNQLWTRLDDQQADYKGLYNGNIAWMQTDLPGLQDKPEQAMLYRYDQLNRLVLAQGLNQFDAATGFAARSGSTGPYDAAYSYDPNGNLLSLDRHKQDGSLLDEFDYSYTPNTNRLASVEDASVETITYDEKVYSSGAIRHDGKVYRSITVKDNATAEAGQPAQLLQANESITLQPSFHAKAGSGFHAKWTTASNTGEELSEFAYEYDAIGNLTHDRGEGTNITWTPYGKVRTVSKGDGTAVSYQYDAAGNRISKRVTSNNQTKTTHYVRDASGNVLSIYQDEALQEQPIYGSSRLGMYRPKDSKADGSLSLGQRNYELSNHLGNVLSVITDEVKINVDGLHEPVILQQQDYRPFGLAMEGRSWQSEDYSYRHGFNGKEKDTDFQNNYDYGFRIYNPSIGKFLSVDPLIKKYPELSAYQFASNTPIQAIDQDGLEAFIVHGTQQTQTGVNFTSEAVSQFKRIGGNTVSDDKFRWNAPIYNNSKMRKVAAEQLVTHIVETRAKMMVNGEITENESITLVGYSHGGNVSVLAAQMLNDKFGIKVNIVTVGTPAKNSVFDTDADNWLFGNSEDPQGNPGINSHYHIRHVNDMVWKIADAAGDKSDPYYSNEPTTTNWDITNIGIKLTGPIESHTDLPSHPKLKTALKQLPKMPAAPAAGKLEEKK